MGVQGLPSSWKLREKKKSQKTELQREKTPLRFLAGSVVGHDSKESRGKHSWRAEKAE